MSEEKQPPPEQGIVFHIEVAQAQGLPKPEVTFIQIAGLGLEEDYASEAQVEESMEPGPFLFQSLEALAEAKRLKAEAEAAAGKKKKEDDSRPASIDPPTALCRISKPCQHQAERQRLLDSVCTPMRLKLFRNGATPVPLAEATIDLSALIHDTAVLDLDVDLKWSESLLEELRAEYEKEVAAAAEAAEAKAAEEAEDPEAQKEPGEAEMPPPFSEPPPGRLMLKISTAAPIGRILCPEDLHDWAILTVRLDGLYHLPQKLLEAGGPLPEPGTAEGLLETHPLRYSLRVLGCEFNGGQLILPHIDLPPEEAEAKPAEGADETAEPADPETPVSPTHEPDISFDIGMEEFQESLMRAGFPGKVDGPAVFNFLCRPRTGLGGRIGLHDFLRLLEITVPATAEQLVELHSLLVEKHESLETAFSAIDTETEGFLTRQSLTTGLEQMGVNKEPEEVEALFVALDSSRAGYVTREDFRVLGVRKRLKDLEAASKAYAWLLSATGSIQALLRQVDAQQTGSITRETFVSAATQLGYTDEEALDHVFAFAYLAEADSSATLGHQAFQSLTCLESVSSVPSSLSALEKLLYGEDGFLGSPGEAALQALMDDPEAASISCPEFLAGIKRLDGEGTMTDVQALFFVLDAAAEGKLGPDAFASLQAVNAAEQWRRLAACRSFIESGFGGIDHNTFKALFDSHAEHFVEAEESLPRVEWSGCEVRGYRGREWLQRLLNTLGDDRGRNAAADPLSQTGGTWLYMFPVLSGQGVVDFKELPEAQAALAKLARWHHAQAFLDLRRILAPPDASGGPEVEFRAFFTQVGAQPKGEFESEEFSALPFKACETYVKGVIRLDRPLMRLCPRDVRPALQPSGEPYIPPPPEKRPPPTVNDELEKEASKVIARLAFEFARWCHETGLEETKTDPVNPANAESIPLLGHKGVNRGEFLQWLQDGTTFRDLGNKLRPAIVRLVRAENKNGPSCGLNGNENDAKYSYLCVYILKHLVRALNADVDKHRRLRDEKLWRSPQSQLDDAPDAETVQDSQKQEDLLKRLIFEYELVGDWQRAREMYEEWLALEHNVENGEAWCSFARFLMRCGQNQLDAERVLRYAISLKSTEGPDFLEVSFLACLLQNQGHPCSLDAEEVRTARFEAALAMMEGYTDRHAFDRMPLYILFLICAVEAHAVEAQAASVEGEEAVLIAEQGNRLSAEACKYLELARSSKDRWTGTLDSGLQGAPRFAELEALVAKEQINRGQVPEAPAERPPEPEAWHPPKRTVFPDAKSLRRLPDNEDANALELVDLMLHFGLPDHAVFLLTYAVQAYGFVSSSTAASERCQLQLLKAAMLSKDWSGAESLVANLFASRGADRIPEAHALLAECRFRAAREAPNQSPSVYQSSLDAFETALSFMVKPEVEVQPAPGPPPVLDPVLHLRVGQILHLRAEEQGFEDASVADRAVKHYKKSVMVAPTAEAWKSIGVCTYRRAQFEPSAPRRERKLQQASKYLQEANVLDRERPDTLVWLTICAVELGHVQVAKQGFRQLMQFDDRLEQSTALELAELLLRFSNEQKASEWGGERGRLVQDGRYAKEAGMIAKSVLGRAEVGQARHILAWSLALDGEHAAAAGEFCAALPLLVVQDPHSLGQAADMARHCASMVPGEPQLVAMVEEAIAAAIEQQAAQVDAASSAFEGVSEDGQVDIAESEKAPAGTEESPEAVPPEGGDGGS